MSIRISLRNFVGNIFNSDIMRKTAKKRKIERKDEKKKLLMALARTHGNAMFGNIMADFMFKRLFGNKLIMLPFLRAVLPEEDIADIDYINTEELGDTPLDNKVVFDIACTTSDGRELIIEMQKACQTNFKNRSITYVASHISSQARKQREIRHTRTGEPWKYDLNPVHIIALLNFSFTHEKDYPKEKYISNYHLREDETHELFNKTLNFTFIEMARFLKSEPECETILDKLTYSLKHMHELDTPPAFFDEEFFRLLYNLSELNNFTAREIKSYMRSLYAESDYANTIDYAEQVGEARGIEKGIAIGEERTLARRNAEIATAMLADGVDIATICKYTHLTPEEVERLRQ